MTEAPLLPDLIAALPLPTLVIDRAERIAAVNPAARALIGAHTVGRHFVTVLRQPALVDAVERCIEDGQGRQAQYLASEADKDVTFDQLPTKAPPLAPEPTARRTIGPLEPNSGVNG